MNGTYLSDVHVTGDEHKMFKLKQGRTGTLGCLALARSAGWSSVQVGLRVKC